MSFAEHLDELRKTLVKAFVWLGIGCAIGLYFGEAIVKYISSPLKDQLTQFYIAQAKRQFEKANGVAPSDEFGKWMTLNGVVPERVYIDPSGIDSDLTAVVDAAATIKPDGQAEKSSDDKAKEEIAEQKLLESNAWKGIDMETLRRLRPMLIWRPIQNKLLTFNALEGFMIWLKAGLVAGVIFGSPGIFYHIWQFIAAGLYPHERRYVYWYLPLSLLLFFGGVCLAFFVIFKLVLGFLLTYNLGLDIDIAPRLNEYMSFALMLPLGFGLAFQLPIVMLGLHRFGVVSVDTFKSQWRIAVLAIAFLSMILTPADIYSMLGMFIPLVGLYWFGILLCKYMPQGQGLGSQAFDPVG